MKKTLSRIVSLCLLLTLLAGIALPGFAAAEKVTIRGGSVLWIGTGKNAVLLDNLPENAKSFKITSDNKAVLKVGKSGNDAFGMWMKPLKAGKSKVTVTYQTGNTTHKVVKTYKVKKYPNPFAWIKVDGKKLSVKKDLVFSEVTGYSKDKLTIDYKLNSGWKKTGLTGVKFRESGNVEFSWKKNKAFSIAKAGAVSIDIQLKNTKTGDVFDYIIVVSR